MVGVPAGELDDHLLQLQLALTDGTTLLRFFVVPVIQLFDLLLGKALRDLTDFVPQIEELLS